MEIELSTYKPKIFDDPVYCAGSLLTMDDDMCLFLWHGRCYLFELSKKPVYSKLSIGDEDTMGTYYKCSECKKHYNLNK